MGGVKLGESGARQAGRAAGFTLIEVMITVAIVAILATIALPWYGDYITRSRILSATTGLSDFRTKMEQYFQDNRRFDNGGGCGVVDPPSGPNDSFRFNCALSANNGYTVNANGQGPMAGVQYRLVVNLATGVARSTVAPPAGWSVPVPNNCWATRKDGSCS